MRKFQECGIKIPGCCRGFQSSPRGGGASQVHPLNNPAPEHMTWYLEKPETRNNTWHDILKKIFLQLEICQSSREHFFLLSKTFSLIALEDKRGTTNEESIENGKYWFIFLFFNSQKLFSDALEDHLKLMGSAPTTENHQEPLCEVTKNVSDEKIRQKDG